MPYPQAPWSLYGHALMTLSLVDVDRVRPLIPPELKIISIFPGKTLGGVYLSVYGDGSTLQYHELIVVAALVNHSGYIGSWISHIYVDNPDSVAGGREIWGLPKELADFSWTLGEASSATVQQGNTILCKLNHHKRFPLWKQSFSGQSFGLRNADLLRFTATVKAPFQVETVRLDIPEDSPLQPLGLSQPWFAIAAEDMDLVVDAPEPIAQLQQPWYGTQQAVNSR